MRVAAMDRRHFLMSSTVAGVAALGLSGCAAVPGGAGVRPLDPEIDELQRRTFQWFVDTTNRANGLTPDRWPKKSFASIAAVGFALTCWPGCCTPHDGSTATIRTKWRSAA